MFWHFYWMNSAEAIVSIHWQSSRHLLGPGVSLVWTLRWVLFFPWTRVSSKKQAAKSRTLSTGGSQTIFALTLCFGELQCPSSTNNSQQNFQYIVYNNVYFFCTVCTFHTHCTYCVLGRVSWITYSTTYCTISRSVDQKSIQFLTVLHTHLCTHSHTLVSKLYKGL